MSSNGERRPPRPRIQIVSARASDDEAAAIVAAVERFLADTAPTPAIRRTPSRWQRAGLEDGVSRSTRLAWGPDSG